MKSVSLLRFIIFTAINLILAYYISVLLHEYSHATAAWLFGYKDSPFDIQYGSWYLIPISENVDFNKIIALGHSYQAALIGISGIAGTTLLFLICLYFLNKNSILKSSYLINFFFLLASINLIEILSYVPNRTFTGVGGDISDTPGDIGLFVSGFNISPLWVFIPGILLVSLAFYRVYKYELIKMFSLIPRYPSIQRVVLWLTFWPLIMMFAYWIPPVEYKVLSYMSSIYSIILILFILIGCDPARVWVKKAIDRRLLKNHKGF